MSRISILAVLGLFTSPLFAAEAPEQKSLDTTGVAVVCASETTQEVEDASTRLNKKLALIRGDLEISAPTLQFSSGGALSGTRSNLCVSVNKKR